MSVMFHAVTTQMKQMRHRRIIAGVLDTPGIVPRDDGLVLFSMIGGSVVVPYLVAIKSLHARLRRGRVVLMDDGSLTARDRDLLRRHLGDPAILPIGAVDVGACPRGGTWERLLTILDLRARDYVIQLDSDTVTVGAVPEVLAAIDANRSFTILGEADEDPCVLPFAEFSAKRWPKGPPPFEIATSHVQGAIEASMIGLTVSGMTAPRYVRGCSGFTGFARGDAGRGAAYAFSAAATAALGAAKWSDWGSEQVTSNFVIANEPDPLLLPYDRYLNYWNEPPPADARFVHFIGTHRYANRAYANASQTVIGALA